MKKGANKQPMMSNSHLPLGENVGIKLYVAFELNSSIAETTIYSLLQFISYSQHKRKKNVEISGAKHNFIYWKPR